MDQFFKFNSFMELRAQAQKEYLEVNDRLMTEDEVIAFVEQARKEIREEKMQENNLNQNLIIKSCAVLDTNVLVLW